MRGAPAHGLKRPLAGGIATPWARGAASEGGLRPLHVLGRGEAERLRSHRGAVASEPRRAAPQSPGWLRLATPQARAQRDAAVGAARRAADDDGARQRDLRCVASAQLRGHSHAEQGCCAPPLEGRRCRLSVRGFPCIHGVLFTCFVRLLLYGTVKRRTVTVRRVSLYTAYACARCVSSELMNACSTL